MTGRPVKPCPICRHPTSTSICGNCAMNLSDRGIHGPDPDANPAQVAAWAAQQNVSLVAPDPTDRACPTRHAPTELIRAAEWIENVVGHLKSMGLLDIGEQWIDDEYEKMADSLRAHSCGCPHHPSGGKKE